MSNKRKRKLDLGDLRKHEPQQKKHISDAILRAQQKANELALKLKESKQQNSLDNDDEIKNDNNNDKESINNPLTGLGFSQNYFAILKKRKTLPVWEQKEDFLKIFKKNRITILVGETGSGKTTQIPQFLIDAGYANNGKIIACTQPRRVAAMSVARYDSIV